MAVAPLEPADLDTVKAMLRTCTKTTRFTGARDRVALLFLLDTGCRAGELEGLLDSEAEVIRLKKRGCTGRIEGSRACQCATT